MKNFVKKNFITGLLVVVPVGVTVFVLKGIFNWIDSILPQELRNFFVYDFPGLGIITLLLLILVIGIVSANYFGSRLVRAWDRLMHRLPLVRGVYSTVKQVMETFSVKQSFSGVALVEYPRKDCWSIGFVTRSLEGAPMELDGPYETVFVPTTPNPTAGFLLILPTAEVRHLDMTVDQGMKFIISLGLVSPGEGNALRLKQPGDGQDAT